jgi:Zn-finger nucleic acid-binding protein
MTCPACGKTARLRSFGPVEADVCDPGCGGIWLVGADLARVDEPDEGFGSALEAALAHVAGPRRSAPLRCTHCGVVMREHRYQNVPGVLVDECYGCGCFFLDPGELRAIRDALGARTHKQERIGEILAGDLPYQRERLATELASDRVRALQSVSQALAEPHDTVAIGLTLIVRVILGWLRNV